VPDAVHLSELLDRPIVDLRGETVGRVADVVVRLRGDAYPLVIGLVGRFGRRDHFLPIDAVADVTRTPLELQRQTLDVRRFERREGEVLLRADVLHHRLIDVGEARLVRAWDVELVAGRTGWTVKSVDTRRPRRLLRFLASEQAHEREDWKAFEPLVGHAASARFRRFGRLRRLKPAQLADLLEEASKDEGSEILQIVHADPELEADVFEEIDPDLQSRLFGARTNEEVAAVLTRMQVDDAADAIAELPQSRRQAVLNLLPAGPRTKVLSLLGYSPSSAGGLMGLDFVQVDAGGTVRSALDALRAADTSVQASTSVYLHDDSGRLVGVAPLSTLLRTSDRTPLRDVADPDPVHAHPEADVTDLALLMSDYNLVTVPVADIDHRMIGIVTVDDVLEETIPESWRRREPDAHPETDTTDTPPSTSGHPAESSGSPVG
jgi:CBS domain-containing protein